MKKITFFALIMGFSLTVQSQVIVLTQSADPVSVTDGGVACWASGTGEYRDNSFLRSYKLADFGVIGDFQITSVQYGQGSADEGKEVHLNIYTADDDDLTSANLTLIATQSRISSASEDLTLISEDFNAVIPAGSIVAFELFAPDSGAGVPNSRYFPGLNGAGESAPSYLMAPDCGVSVPTPVGDVTGVPEFYVMNVVGEDLLSVGSNLADVISVYPIPAKDILNIKLPSSVDVQNASLVNVLGKTTGATYSNGQMNVSGLASGVYFLNIVTNLGTHTQKIVKQ
ncbi:MAG: T9SS type A sorting domain-containing protein [Aequorivita sp.]